VGPRAGLDAVVRRQIPSPDGDSNPRSSSPYPSALPPRHPGSRNNNNNPWIKVLLEMMIKVQVQLSLCFNRSPRHEGVLGSGVIAPLIL
jgi:hypothetical protein